jgi:Cu-processing system permease protein
MNARVASLESRCAASAADRAPNGRTLQPVAASKPKPRAEVGWLRHVWLVAAKEFSDRFRSGWVVVCAAVWLGAIALTSLFGLVQIGRIGVQGYERTVVSLLNLVQYLVPLLGLLLGHDLIVSEREDRTLALLLAGGLGRTRLLWGKFLGGGLTLAFPLTLGFIIAGALIGSTAKDSAVAPFVVLALSGLALGLVFLAIGLWLSTLCRTRVQALVGVLLAWCVAVFAFDLIALGVIVAAHSAKAAHEIELATDATHVTSIAEMHQAFEADIAAPSRAVAERSLKIAGWLALNPVDMFRAVNLPKSANVAVPAWLLALSAFGWLAGSLGLAARKLRRTDL